MYIYMIKNKLMELEKANLSEVTQTQKTNIMCTHSEVDIRHKAKENQPTITTP